MTVRIQRIIILLLLALTGASASAAIPADSTVLRYLPTVHGTFRGWYEIDTGSGDSRFLIRNARLSATGMVLPKVDYSLQMDFCDKGRIELVDAYVRVSPQSRLKIFFGKSRVPFSVSACRAKQKYYFFNRSFIGKYAGNLHNVGIKAGYSIGGTPLYVEGGVFNATDYKDQPEWNSAGLTYSIKANAALPGGLTPEICFMSRQNGTAGAGTRMNQFDASIHWEHGPWTAEAEYLYSDVCGPYPVSHQYDFILQYTQGLRGPWVNAISYGARFDGHTKASSGFYTDGEITTDYPEVKRLTLGLTATCRRGDAHFDLRLNYENYFYRSGTIPSDKADDKVCAGVVLYF